ncbi:MAG: flagellar export protein FliJ [Nitrospinae bacterium]|nr:flagellar export protein FliJ [Nitrospinota bacterium]MCH8312433.1 flagellar export protein FliJ [Nitrospinota bacterium]
MKFRFETVLKVHKEKENQIKKELGVINTHMQNQMDRLRFMEGIADEKKEELNHIMGQDINIDKMVLYNNFFTGVNLEKVRQEQVISEVTEKLNLKKQDLIQSMMKRRTMEIIKEREQKAFKKKQQKIEIALNDEIGSKQWWLNS